MRADGTEADLPPHVPTAPHSVAERWPESALKASAVARDEAKSAAPMARRFEEGGSTAERSTVVRSTVLRSTVVRSTVVRSPVVRSTVVRSPVVRSPESAETESAETESAEMAAC